MLPSISQQTENYSDSDKAINDSDACMDSFIDFFMSLETLCDEEIQSGNLKQDSSILLYIYVFHRIFSD